MNLLNFKLWPGYSANVVHAPAPQPSGYHYVDTGLNMTGVRSVVFSVKACANAHFCVSSKPKCKGENFIALVGGFSNKGSVIR